METSVKTLRADGAETRARLKEVAQRLFAERGIDGVAVQDIVTAAGQRNNASLRYYFGTKTELARELVVDGARLIDERRQAMVDTLEKDGPPKALRGLMEALSIPVLELPEKPGQANYIRMVANFQLNHRAFLREALADTWNVGYKRCIAHLVRLLPHIPKPILEQRISLSGIYGNAVWAARETALAADAPSEFWSKPYTISNVIDTLQLFVEAPPSEATLALLPKGRRSARPKA